MNYLFDNVDTVRSLLLKHLVLSLIPIVLGFVIALPIGWFASRNQRLRWSVAPRSPTR
ncbi:hypothetical protein [Aeromicrobium sp.]|uniref:hypothetical protein n=1 Tax=Aeromicrobium sp. TaxID=1871063 RepID=UPI001986F8A5|nr:hypothetical protein [Aeromicrobium sp.]MBC7631555.1 hypothetical protein [Aeromicrobium sp.]